MTDREACGQALRVARPRECNGATIGANRATVSATPVQQKALHVASTRECNAQRSGLKALARLALGQIDPATAPKEPRNGPCNDSATTAENTRNGGATRHSWRLLYADGSTSTIYSPTPESSAEVLAATGAVRAEPIVPQRPATETELAELRRLVTHLCLDAGPDVVEQIVAAALADVDQALRYFRDYQRRHCDP